MAVKLLSLAYLAWMADARMIESAGARRLACDPYCIDYKNTSEVVFSNTTENEFILYFNISNSTEFDAMEDVRGLVMNYNCSGEVPDAESLVSSTISDETVDLGGGFQEIALLVNIKEDKIQGSDLWRDITNSTGVIEFCMKTKITAHNISISFQETKMAITVDMTAGFEMTATAERLDPIFENVTANMDYALTGCMCNPSDCSCTNEAMKQNEQFYLCINSSSDEVKVSEVFSLKMYQKGDLIFSPIDNGQTSLTTVDYDGACAVVESRTISTFFTESPPPPVTAQGTAFMEFSTGEGEDGRTRLLRAARGLAPQGEVTTFDVTMNLQDPALSAPSGKKDNVQTVAEAPKSSDMGIIVMSSLLFVVLFSTAVVWKTRSMQWTRLSSK